MSRPLASLPNLDIDLARTFVAICESGNFSRAAELVHRTPSAVSLQVKKLEDMVGRALFRREPRAVVPTGDGEMLLGYARRLLRLNDEAMARFLVPQIEGRVSFGAPNDSGIFAIPGILKRFASTHPQVAVDVRLDCSAELRRRCAAGELDVAIVSCGEKPNSSSEEIYSEALVWIGLRNGRAAEQTPLPLALADQGCSWRGRALDALDSVGRDYRIAYSSELCQGQIAAVEADLAIAPLPASVLSSTLVRLNDPERLPPLGSYRVFMMRRDGAGPAADALAQHVSESFRDLSDRQTRIFA
ncbi:MAG TPA: LysR family transcriptional regulator [Aurantimonas coralicida]|uniref:LysR family transcriptional regulator n=2 Tax=root TaxID=1 RepID=A0A9C9NCH6_9HYPH|nr:LysR family transcriptional regulator [Aurantimonas coralicida]HET98828.1 LysR family transcriptional regulator [Aurantimonas coralicida]